MKKKKKYLPLYYKWMERGRMPESGLCVCIMKAVSRNAMLEMEKLFLPEDYDYSFQTNHWASGDLEYAMAHVFTALRQNIVLFLAAMNDEL